MPFQASQVFQISHEDNMRTIFKVRVITKDIISDTFARFRSIVGGRVKVYERAIQEGLEDAYAEMVKEYPSVKNVRFGTTEMLQDGCELVLYGEVEDIDYEKHEIEKYEKQKQKSK